MAMAEFSIKKSKLGKATWSY